MLLSALLSPVGELPQPHHAEQLATQGFTVVRGVVDEALLNALRTTVEALVESEETQHLQQDRFTGSLIPVTKDATFARLIAHDGVLATLGGLGFDDLRFMSG